MAAPFTPRISPSAPFCGLYILFFTVRIWTKFSGSRHRRRLNHFLLPQTLLRIASRLSVDQCGRLTPASRFLALFHIFSGSDIYECLIGAMTANSRCSAAEPPGLETQQREIESLLRQCELRAGDSWWVRPPAFALTGLAVSTPRLTLP